MNRRTAVLKPADSWRFLLVLAVLLCLGFALIARIVMLQVVPDVDHGYEFLQRQGEARTIRAAKVPASRGIISDRNGKPLAVSTPVVSIYANPKELDESLDFDELAKALGVSGKKLKQKLDVYKNKSFVYLRKKLPPADAEKILQKNFKGIYSEKGYQRFYPAGEVTSHVLGFTDINDQGQEGVELAYNHVLVGNDGEKTVVNDRYGRIIRDIRQVSAAKNGEDISLTLDLRLQFLAYRALKEAVKQRRAKAASLVLVDVKNSEILAMVNQPGFNPNDRASLKINSLRNRAITDVFEPGSTVKPFTMIAALESGKFYPGSVINTSPGILKVGRKTLHDPVNYGEINLTKIITKSSQVGTSKVALALDEQRVRDVFFRLGLGQVVGLGFPGEASGYLPNHSRWRDIERVTFAFGHGLSVSAVQLAQAYVTIANRGESRPLSLLKGEKVQAQQVISAKVAKKITAMLKTVTEKGGTAVRAAVPAYSVAGKTGTAHKVGKDGYADGRYVSIFAGFAPASNPRLAAVVVVDEPSSGDEYYGGEVAAPIFSRVMGGALRVFDISPDNFSEFDVKQIVGRH